MSSLFRHPKHTPRFAFPTASSPRCHPRCSRPALRFHLKSLPLPSQPLHLLCPGALACCGAVSHFRPAAPGSATLTGTEGHPDRPCLASSFLQRRRAVHEPVLLPLQGQTNAFLDAETIFSSSFLTPLCSDPSGGCGHFRCERTELSLRHVVPPPGGPLSPVRTAPFWPWPSLRHPSQHDTVLLSRMWADFPTSL